MADDLPRDLVRAFRLALVLQLSERGAATLDEIVDDPPEPLDLPLNRSEIHEALDAARRHREIEPLGTVSELASAEWALTDYGRQAACPLHQRIVAWAGTSGAKFLGGAIGIGAAFGLSVSVKDITDDQALSLVFLCVFAVEALLFALSHYRYGQGGGRIARSWSRYRRSRPVGWRFYKSVRWQFPSVVAAVLIPWVGFLIVPAGDAPLGVWLVLTLCGIGGAVGSFVLISRSNSAQQEALEAAIRAHAA